MDKRLIAERFARARATYSREARVQQQVAEKMTALLRRTLPDARFDRIAEFGCGTGLYSQLIHDTWHPSLLHLNDLCPEMRFCLEGLTARPGVAFEAGDAETCPLPGGLDLLTSCSTLQWFASPRDFFRRAASLLRPGGVLAFTTFGLRNLLEIRTLTGNGLDYTPPQQLRHELEDAGFCILHLEQEEAVLRFPTPVDVLRHLRMTGVTGTEKQTWSRGRLQAFCDEYIRRFGSPEGVSLTYQPIYVISSQKNTNNMNNIYFISGIDTDAGKSYCTAWYAAQLIKEGRRVITQKFIQTGNVGHSEDIDLHRRLMGTGYLPEDREGLTMPEIFSYPASPDLAARIDHREINFERIDRATQELARRYDTVLVEGAGGLMVPLKDEYLTIDYIAERGYPLVFVTSGKLGSVNHTLLSLEAVARRGIRLDTVLYNLYPTLADTTIQQDTQQYLRRYLGRHFPQCRFLTVPVLEG